MRKKSNLIAIAVAMSLVGSSTVMAATNVQAGEKTQTEEVQIEESKDATADANKEESTEETSKEESTLDSTEESTEAEQETLPEETSPSIEESLEETLPETEEQPEESQTESTEDMTEESTEAEVTESIPAKDNVNNDAKTESCISKEDNNVKNGKYVTTDDPNIFENLNDVIEEALKSKESDTTEGVKVNLGVFEDQVALTSYEDIIIPEGKKVIIDARGKKIGTYDNFIKVYGDLKIENANVKSPLYIEDEGELEISGSSIYCDITSSGKYCKIYNKTSIFGYEEFSTGCRVLIESGEFISDSTSFLSVELKITGGNTTIRNNTGSFKEFIISGGEVKFNGVNKFSQDIDESEIPIIIITGGKVLINGGIITPKGLEISQNSDGGNIKVETGYNARIEGNPVFTINSDATPDKYKNINLIISNGYYTNTGDEQIINCSIIGGFIKGGVFSEDINQKYIAEGYKSVYREQSTYIKEGYYVVKSDPSEKIFMGTEHIGAWAGIPDLSKESNKDDVSPFWEISSDIIFGKDSIDSVDPYYKDRYKIGKIDETIIPAVKVEKLIEDYNFDDPNTEIHINCIIETIGGKVVKVDNTPKYRSFKFFVNARVWEMLGNRIVNGIEALPNSCLNGRNFYINLTIPTFIKNKTVKIRKNGSTQTCEVKSLDDGAKYITIKTNTLSEVVYSELDYENLNVNDYKDDYFEMFLDDMEVEPEPNPNPGSSGSTGGSSSGSSGGGSGSGNVAGHGYGSGSSNSNVSSVGTPNLPAIAGEKNSAGQTVIGNTAVAFLTDKNAAVAGLPENIVSQINGVNSGAKLADIIKDVDLNGFTALNATQAFIMRDTVGNVKTAITPISLQIPSLVTGLNNVHVLFYNNATGKWEVIVPTAVDFNGKIVTANLPGSGTLTVIYKK